MNLRFVCAQPATKYYIWQVETMINNLEHIKPLLNFENVGDFYMLYVFKRKKDQ